MKKLTELEIKTLVIECLQALEYGLPLAVRRMCFVVIKYTLLVINHFWQIILVSFVYFV